VSYRILILRRAQKELADLPPRYYASVKEGILSLGADPRPSQSRKLVGRDSWRLRVGDYRIIYEIEDAQQSVVVLHVGHRRDVYR